MALTVRRLTSADVGGYRCVAKNSLGEVDSVIRLYGKHKLLFHNCEILMVIFSQRNDLVFNLFFLLKVA